jgi:hypothetical protein
MTRSACCGLLPAPILVLVGPLLIAALTADALPILLHRIRSRAKRSITTDEVTLTSRTGYLLTINPSGSVIGSAGIGDPNGEFLNCFLSF